MLTPEQRTLRAKIAGSARWARENPGAHTKMMRDKFEQRFLREVDPDGVLPEQERERRAQSARRAYFARLALASSNARRARASGGDAA